MNERKFLYGQRVIAFNQEIGIIRRARQDIERDRLNHYWVQLSSDKHATLIHVDHLAPLPNGQL